MQDLEAQALLSEVQQGGRSDLNAALLFMRLPSVWEDKLPHSHKTRSKSRETLIKCKSGKDKSNATVTQGRGGRLGTLKEGMIAW